MDLQDLTLARLRDLTEATLTIGAAHEAGIFEVLGEAPTDAEDVSKRLGLNAHATWVVCEALVELGLLEPAAGAYRPTPRCMKELCEPAGDAYVGGGLTHWFSSMRTWTRLNDALRQGGPVQKKDGPRDEGSLASFMAAMAAAPAERVARIVDLCLSRAPDAASMLDVGGGPGHMCRAFAERGLNATLFDTAEVTDYVPAAYGLRDVPGLSVATGDFTADPLPDGPFDVVLISNILHMFPAETNRALLAEVARVTAPGGTVAVAEFLRGRSGRAGRFGIQMLLHTEGGDAYAEGDIAVWLADVGFGDVRVDALDADRQLLTAVRAP